MRLIRLLKNDLKQEIHDWVEQKIINPEQASAICDLYGVDYHADKKNHAYSVLMILGYLFIGLAVITLLSANWDDIPRGLRMGGLITLTLSVNLWALHQYRQQNVNAAIGWFFLGSLFYGASIMLIAQIYHLGEHYPDGILWWTIGVLPLAVILNSAVLLLLATGLGFTWFIVETSLGFYPTLFPILLWFIFQFLHTSKQHYYSLFIALVVGITVWLEYSVAWWFYYKQDLDFDGGHLVAFSVGLFLLYHSIAKYLMQTKNIYWASYGTLLAVWVLRFTLLALLVFSFEVGWEGLLHLHWEIVLSLSIAVLLSVLAILVSYQAQKQHQSTLLFSGAYLLILTLVMLLDSSKFAVFFQILDNVVLIAAGIWLIVRGLRDNISHYFFLGILTIMLTALLRYFNFIGDYVGASILFIVFALILLSAAKYWRVQQRKNAETA